MSIDRNRTDSGPPGPAPTPTDKAAVAEEVKDKASEVASTAAEKTKNVAAEASTQVTEVLGHTKVQLQGFVDQTKNELGTQLEERGQQAAASLQTVSQQLMALTDGRPQEAGPFVGYVQEAQSRVQGFAQKLEQGGPEAVFADVAAFARRRPVAFLAGAAFIGFAVGRTVRAGAAASQEGMTGAVGKRQSINATAGMVPQPTYAESAAALGGSSVTAAHTP